MYLSYNTHTHTQSYITHSYIRRGRLWSRSCYTNTEHMNRSHKHICVDFASRWMWNVESRWWRRCVQGHHVTLSTRSEWVWAPSISVTHTESAWPRPAVVLLSVGQNTARPSSSEPRSDMLCWRQVSVKMSLTSCCSSSLSHISCSCQEPQTGPDQQLVSRLSSSLIYLQWNDKRTTSQASVLCTVAQVHVRVWKGSCLGWKYLVLFTNTARKCKDVLLKISSWVSSSNGGLWLDVLLAQSKSSAGVKWQPVSGWILRTSGNVLYEKD